MYGGEQHTNQIKDIIPFPYPLMSDVSPGDFTGVITISSKANNSRQILYSIDVIYEGKDGILPNFFEIFYPGLKFIFIGNSCIPDKSRGYDSICNIRHEVEGGTMGLKDGKIVTSGTGRIRISGTINMLVADKASVYEIQTLSSEPFVLQLTKAGFKYLSGKGIVKLPDGKIFDFSKNS